MKESQSSRVNFEKLTRDQLRELAREWRVPGFASLRKGELIDALKAATKSAPRNSVSPAYLRTGAVRLDSSGQAADDCIESEVMDSRWIRVKWRLTSKTMDRAVVAMGVDWHRARSVLRVYRMTCDDAGPRSKSLEMDQAIPSDVQQWFINVPRPGGTWQIELGYSWKAGEFFSIMHSQPVTLPVTAVAAAEAGGSANIIPQESRPRDRVRKLTVQLQAELSIQGMTTSGATVRIDDQKVPVSKGGAFRWSISLVDGRRAIPLEVEREDFARQRILIAIERNTRFLEPESLP